MKKYSEYLPECYGVYNFIMGNDIELEIIIKEYGVYANDCDGVVTLHTTPFMGCGVEKVAMIFNVSVPNSVLYHTPDIIEYLNEKIREMVDRPVVKKYTKKYNVPTDININMNNSDKITINILVPMGRGELFFDCVFLEAFSDKSIIRIRPKNQIQNGAPSILSKTCGNILSQNRESLANIMSKLYTNKYNGK